MAETEQYIFELHQGLRVSLQADTARGHFNTHGEIIYVSSHHFRVSCDMRVPANALKPQQEIRVFIEGNNTTPIVARFMRPQEEGSHVLILSMPNESTYRNRRAFFRGEIQVPVALHRKNGDIVHGYAVNISGGGLLVSSPQTLNKNEEVEADILFSEAETISVKARVVRTTEREELFELGIKFTEIRRRDQDRICRIVIVQEFENRRAEIRELNEHAPQRP